MAQLRCVHVQQMSHLQARQVHHRLHMASLLRDAISAAERSTIAHAAGKAQSGQMSDGRRGGAIATHAIQAT
jgi:hypothetical protein